MHMIRIYIAHTKALEIGKMDSEKMDSRVRVFLADHNHENESSKFLGMKYLVFLALPVNALRAMGVTDKFIRDHEQLLERLIHRRQLTIRRGRPTFQQEKLELPQRTGTMAPSESPDFSYRTPAAVPPYLDTHATILPKCSYR